MKLKFKIQGYQTAAVNAVIDCFKGQPKHEGFKYWLDKGNLNDNSKNKQLMPGFAEATEGIELAFRNADIALSEQKILANIHNVQREQHLPLSNSVVKTKVSGINLDVEMETGTGKTYCYIKTIFELNKEYGWGKFIIVVPSIAIREGVEKSLEITAEHFFEAYQKKARFFIYNSKQLHQLESFSSDAGINIMVINVQAFNATGKDNRRIYEELDDFQSRKPIDVLSANRPILILDEPQKMEGSKTLESLVHFNSLMVLRYSATHKITNNKVHRLDALDAYNQKLVKKIAVRGISVKGLSGTSAYLYLQGIDIHPDKLPEARVEFEQKLKTGVIRRVTRKLRRGDNLFSLSKELEQYRGYTVSEIDARSDTLSFLNGNELMVGDAQGDVSESALRRIQIRETIYAHFEKESVLFEQGIKVLTLFFIDEVAKYRDYNTSDEKGVYARIFEEEYQQYLEEFCDLLETPYSRYLKSIAVSDTHRGYFSIDKKTRRLSDPIVEKRGENAGLSNDVDAYDLILRDKERLLSLSEPVRFIFSHSALREGWDNPNVFVICALKHSDNSISRRQEVGRGLRLAVNQSGERMDNPVNVHDINVLTVVASESYKDFVTALQKDISEALSARPQKADESYFVGKVINVAENKTVITASMASAIEFWLIQNNYIDVQRIPTEHYFQMRQKGAFELLPGELSLGTESVLSLIDNLFNEKQILKPLDERRAKRLVLNDNFEKKEFKDLWKRINHKAIYNVSFNNDDLIEKAVEALNAQLRVTKMHYTVQVGEQSEQVNYEEIKYGNAFVLSTTGSPQYESLQSSPVKYDLLGKLSESTQLTRRIIATILVRINKAVFAQFRDNPEHFLSETARLINEQKARLIINHLTYDPTDEEFSIDIFNAVQTRQDFTHAGPKLQHHIYDYVLTDSGVERKFVEQLDTCTDVVVYAKLPHSFLIPTPMGDYNPDWAISFKEKESGIKNVFFVAETKGSMSELQLSALEQTKIKCARKFFSKINMNQEQKRVNYEVVDSFESLVNAVGKITDKHAVHLS